MTIRCRHCDGIIYESETAGGWVHLKGGLRACQNPPKSVIGVPFAEPIKCRRCMALIVTTRPGCWTHVVVRDDHGAVLTTTDRCELYAEPNSR